MSIGQREVSAWVFLLVTVLAVVIGQPPEATYDLILEIIAPLMLIAATLLNIMQTIQTRVRSGELKPGTFFKSDGLLGMREFWYAIAVLVAGVVSIGFRDILNIEFTEETKSLVIDLLWNGGMVLGNVLIVSFTRRSSTSAQFIDGDLHPRVVSQG